MKEDSQFIALLLSKGADVNCRLEVMAGETPLGEIIDQCSFKVVKQLVFAGADPTILGFMKVSALERAKQENRRRRQKDFPTIARRGLKKIY